jgi:hypothetical protein
MEELLTNGFENIFLLTNNVELFKPYNINLFDYSPEQFSFFDKLTICKIALEKFENVIYLDCDSRIDLNELKTYQVIEGITTSQHWLDGELKVFYELEKYNTSYFISINDYCEKNNLKINDAPLIEERLFTLSRTKQTEDFLNLFFDLRTVFENNDIEHGNYPVGRAEGLAMGISIINSNIKHNEKDEGLIKLNLKHLPNE